MGKLVKQKHGGALWHVAKGESSNPNGRPRKFISQLKKEGYKQSEIFDAIQVLISMQPDELQAVRDNPKATVLEITIASAILKSIKDGNLDSLETLLTRIYGKPKQELDAKVDITNHVIRLKFGNTEDNG
jgi:hypothetical protein